MPHDETNCSNVKPNKACPAYMNLVTQCLLFTVETKQIELDLWLIHYWVVSAYDDNKSVKDTTYKGHISTRK